MAKSAHRRLWWERLSLAASTGLLLWGPPVIAALLGLVAVVAPQQAPAVPLWEHLVHWLIFGGSVSVLLLCIQAYFEFQRRTYDPTWILRFVDTFDSSEMKQLRAKAAKAIKANRHDLRRRHRDLEDIDDVLDFFEDLGFYEHGGQISPEVAHHSFYHWIRGYYSAARDYLEVWQEEEPAQWEYVTELFETTYETHLARVKCKAVKIINDAQILDFLDQEIGLVDDEP